MKSEAVVIDAKKKRVDDDGEAVEDQTWEECVLKT